jgi:hypothetical protein
MQAMVMLLALVMLLPLGGCGGDFEPGSRVHDVRLLALRADKPFARPGERVELELLVANPKARALEWARGTCTRPVSSTLEGCLRALDAELLQFDPGADALALDVPDDALEGVDAAALPSALIGVVVVACPGTLRKGLTSVVPIECIDARGEPRPLDALEVGIKRIFLREADRNDNPRITRVELNAERWLEEEQPELPLCESESYDIADCPADTRNALSIEIEPGEAGEDELGEGFAEQIIVQLYTSHGVLRDDVRIAGEADNAWALQPVDGETPETATLWIVARDNRGGVSWVERSARVRLP